MFCPNSAQYDSKTIELGDHRQDCLGNMALCPGGFTFSLWFKAADIGVQWSHPFHSTYMLFFVRRLPNGMKPYFTLRNETHHHLVGKTNILSFDNWHHVAITYSKNSGYNTYFDGCIAPDVNPKVEDIVLVHRKFEMGCDNGNKCMKIHYDDLRFWTERKSPQFIRWLWNM